MASDAVTSFAAEAFTLLSLGICIIFLRTYARIRQVGIRNFEADDYLMLLVIIPYTIETALAYTVGAKYNGLTNSAMTDEQRAALSPDSKEYHDRFVGSRSCFGAVLAEMEAQDWRVQDSSRGMDHVRNSVVGYQERALCVLLPVDGK